MFETQGYAANDYTINSYGGGYFNTTSAIDAVKLSFNSGDIDSGTIKLYGVRDVSISGI